ncbi:methyltransferase, partial [Bradyrhizobium sp. NBAIM20]|uniref:methyltransferase n=1 Tax=Bradyrhizobium sp. NBAIM20 TaxID=2793811 RepID=UPI0023EE7041
MSFFDELLEAMGRHRRLLDVGGGAGAFACAAAQAAPQLEVQVFDLPAVAARAAQRFEQAGLAARCQAFGGDFFQDELPAGAD